jgi:hypothetical protein
MLHPPKDRDVLLCILDHRAIRSRSRIIIDVFYGLLRTADTDAAHVACTHLTTSSNLDGSSTQTLHNDFHSWRLTFPSEVEEVIRFETRSESTMHIMKGTGDGSQLKRIH